jgi:hypothetical protein
MVNKEIDALKLGKDFYSQFSKDPIFDEILMISRYIIAWTFVKYFPLPSPYIKILKNYMEFFKKYNIQDYQIILKIKEIVGKIIFLRLNGNVMQFIAY